MYESLYINKTKRVQISDSQLRLRMIQSQKIDFK
jgi:hypothetical protein